MLRTHKMTVNKNVFDFAFTIVDNKIELTYEKKDELKYNLKRWVACMLLYTFILTI